MFTSEKHEDERGGGGMGDGGGVEWNQRNMCCLSVIFIMR